MGCVRTTPCSLMRFWWFSECMALTSRMKSSSPSESNTPAFRHFTATDNYTHTERGKTQQPQRHNCHSTVCCLVLFFFFFFLSPFRRLDQSILHAAPLRRCRLPAARTAEAPTLWSDRWVTRPTHCCPGSGWTLPPGEGSVEGRRRCVSPETPADRWIYCNKKVLFFNLNITIFQPFSIINVALIQIWFLFLQETRSGSQRVT